MSGSASGIDRPLRALLAHWQAVAQLPNGLYSSSDQAAWPTILAFISLQDDEGQLTEQHLQKVLGMHKNTIQSGA